MDLETIRYDLNADGTYNDFVRVIDRNDFSLGRGVDFKLLAGTTIEHKALYTYHPLDGRLQQVSNPQIPGHQFNYAYVPNSNLVDAINGPIHVVDNTWEPNRDVLDIKENRVASTVVSRYDYLVNGIGQRKTLAQSGTAFSSARSVAWNYDALGQVIQADYSENLGDRAYEYDAIGNRKKSADILALPPTDNHTSSALNQYSVVPNHIGAISYDPDGNLIQGSTAATSNLVWDAENRLIAATNNSTGITTTYRYDAFSRRISRSVGILPTTLFIYDAWNCIAEYQFQNSSFSLHTSYLWGMDLSGTMQGAGLPAKASATAGGVGGLLSVRSGAATRFPTYDGNGNITQYLTATGSIAAHFEYDPFGNTVVNTDTTNQFAYRFSTKPLDQPTGLYYYGYRYYDPATGRWPSRDPIGEEGGANLYGFGPNSPTNGFDDFGLSWWTGIPILEPILDFLTGAPKLQDEVIERQNKRFKQFDDICDDAVSNEELDKQTEEIEEATDEMIDEMAKTGAAAAQLPGVSTLGKPPVLPGGASPLGVAKSLIPKKAVSLPVVPKSAPSVLPGAQMTKPIVYP